MRGHGCDCWWRRVWALLDRRSHGWLVSSHMYIALFTTAPVGSAAALGVGLGWSLGFGALGGALIALAYNALAFLDR